MSAIPDVPANAEWWQLDDQALSDAGKRIEQRRRADYVRQVEVVAQIWDRTSRSKDNRSAIVEDLRAQWKITRVEARDLLRHAELFERDTIHQAASDGLLSARHLNVIDKTLAETPEPDRDEVTATLLDNAAAFDAAKLHVLARRILQHLDQDGKAPDDRELAEPARELHLSSRKDGSVVFRGKVDPETGAKWAALLDPLARPTSADDARTTPHRQGDAFAEIIDLAASSDDLPDAGGERPHLALTMSLRDLQEQRGTAEVDGMGPVDAASARRIACDSTVFRAVLAAKSEVLDIGRATRAIPTPIRRALIIRDGGCAFPTCDRRPRQCEGHHAVHWAEGGPTSLDNLVLLCGHHHRLIHHSHWQVRINQGVPEFTAGPDRGQRWQQAGR
jgi:hypothetical protein